nr:MULTISPECIES: DUF2516 family protein [unclassified Mycolicibacterium]
MLGSLVGYVLFALKIAVFGLAGYAFAHAALQRSDAYTAVDKLTKPVWLAILGGVAIVDLFLIPPPVGAAIAACGAGVYLVDVRPKLLDVQGKSR